MTPAGKPRRGYAGGMHGLGLREAVALAVLLAAVLVALPFALERPSDGDPRDPSVANTAPRPTAAPVTPTPTPLPPTPTPTPQPLVPKALLGWSLHFESEEESGSYAVAAAVRTETVDIAVPSYPFPDVPDDRWRLVAEGLLATPADGRYRLELEFDGELRVLVDGNLVVATDDPREGPRRTQVEFEHAAGTAALRFEVRDVGGPVVLRLLAPPVD